MIFTPQHRSRRRRSGFSLVEVLVATAIASVITVGLYTLMQAGMIVGVRSLAINNTGNASRTALDRVEQLLQVAYDNPTPIQRNGSPQTAATDPAPGVRFYRFISGPYEVDIPVTGLSGSTTSLTVFCRTQSSSNAPPPPPKPQPNDVLVINTTILMSGSSSQIYAHVDSVTGTTTQTRNTSNGEQVQGVRYNITLTEALTENGGMIPHGSTTTVTAVLIRPTALLVVPSGENRELRLYESFPNAAQLDVTKNFRVITSQIAWEPDSSGPTATDDFATPFQIRTIGGKIFIATDLRIRNDRYDRYLSTQSRHEFSTFTSLKSRIPVKCNPNNI